MDVKPAPAGWFMSESESSARAHYFAAGENSAACRNDLVRTPNMTDLSEPAMQAHRCKRCVHAMSVRS